MKQYAQQSMLILLALIWSGHLILVQQIGAFLPVLLTGASIRIGTCVILTAALICSHRFSGLRPKSGKEGVLLLCVGVLGFLLDYFSFLGLQNASSNVGSALLKTDVFFALLLGAFVFKTSRRPHLREYAATMVLLIGVLLILDIRPGAVHVQKTDLFFIASALCVTLNAFLIQHIQKKYATKNDVIAFYNNFFTMLLFLAAHLCTQEMKAASQNNPQLLVLIAAAGSTQALIYLLYYRGLAVYPVWLVKTVLLLMPVFSMLLNLLFFDVRPSLRHVFGTIIVLASAAYILCVQKESARQPGSTGQNGQ